MGCGGGWGGWGWEGVGEDKCRIGFVSCVLGVDVGGVVWMLVFLLVVFL